MVRYWDEDSAERAKRQKLIKNSVTSLRSVIADSFQSGQSVAMPAQVEEAARAYYLDIVGDPSTSFKEKKKRICRQLVRNQLGSLRPNGGDARAFELNYQIGDFKCTGRQAIQRFRVPKGSVCTFGRHKHNDICSGTAGIRKDMKDKISRFHCFNFVIGDALFVMDGWSMFGTCTLSVNNHWPFTSDRSLSSMPNRRMLMRFNKTDRVHLVFHDGQSVTVELVLNPKDYTVFECSAILSVLSQLASLRNQPTATLELIAGYAEGEIHICMRPGCGKEILMRSGDREISWMRSDVNGWNDRRSNEWRRYFDRASHSFYHRTEDQACCARDRGLLRGCRVCHLGTWLHGEATTYNVCPGKHTERNVAFDFKMCANCTICRQHALDLSEEIEGEVFPGINHAFCIGPTTDEWDSMIKAGEWDPAKDESTFIM